MNVLVQHRARLYRDAVSTALSARDDVTVVGSVPLISDAVAVCAQEPVDVALLDVRSDGNPDFEAVLPVRAESPATRIVCLVPNVVDSVVVAGARAHCHQLVSASAGIEALCDVLRDPAPALVPPPVSQLIVPVDGRPQLTPREQEVLERIASGESRASIAQALRISAKTVDNHKRNLMQKLDAKSQPHAVSLGLRLGLLRHTASRTDET